MLALDPRLRSLTSLRKMSICQRAVSEDVIRAMRNAGQDYAKNIADVIGQLSDSVHHSQETVKETVKEEVARLLQGELDALVASKLDALVASQIKPIMERTEQSLQARLVTADSRVDALVARAEEGEKKLQEEIRKTAELRNAMEWDHAAREALMKRVDTVENELSALRELFCEKRESEDESLRLVKGGASDALGKIAELIEAELERVRAGLDDAVERTLKLLESDAHDRWRQRQSKKRQEAAKRGIATLRGLVMLRGFKNIDPDDDDDDDDDDEVEEEVKVEEPPNEVEPLPPVDTTPPLALEDLESNHSRDNHLEEAWMAADGRMDAMETALDTMRRDLQSILEAPQPEPEPEPVPEVEEPPPVAEAPPPRDLTPAQEELLRALVRKTNAQGRCLLELVNENKARRVREQRAAAERLLLKKQQANGNQGIAVTATHCLSCLRPNSPGQPGMPPTGTSMRPLPRESPRMDELHVRRASSSAMGRPKFGDFGGGGRPGGARPVSGGRTRPASAGANAEGANAGRRRSAALAAAASQQVRELERAAAMVPESIRFEEFFQHDNDGADKDVDRVSRAVVHGLEDPVLFPERADADAVRAVDGWNGLDESEEELLMEEPSGISGALPVRKPAKTMRDRPNNSSSDNNYEDDGIYGDDGPYEGEAQGRATTPDSMGPLDVQQQRLQEQSTEFQRRVAGQGMGSTQLGGTHIAPWGVSGDGGGAQTSSPPEPNNNQFRPMEHRASRLAAPRAIHNAPPANVRSSNQRGRILAESNDEGIATTGKAFHPTAHRKA